MVGLLHSHRNLARHPILGPALFLVWMAFGIVLLTAWIGGAYGPVRSYTLAASDMRHDKGCAYIAQVEKRPLGWPFLEFAGDSPGNQASRLLLTVDGLPVPNGHAPHKVIALSGAAGYSYWGKELWFSAADCSDPRTNGRRYQVSVPLSPSLLAYGLACLAWLYFGFGLTRHCADNFALSNLCTTLRTSADLLFTPVDLVRRPRLATAMALAILLYSGGYLMWIWTTGQSVSYALAGWLPFSDAAGYWACANALLDTGNLAEWCQRRAAYPAFLAGINMLGGRQFFYVLLLQSVFIAGAIFVLVRRISAHIPGVATVASAGLLLAYAMNYAFATTMTENAGLIFGCLALALLVIAAEKRSLPWVLAGSALLSVALNARAGALLVLPALVLWAGITAWLSGGRVWRWVAGTAIAILAGFAVQVGLLFFVGGDITATQSNFSYTFYGLSVGGLGWEQVKVDHPEVLSIVSGTSRSHVIYALAWQNVTTEPMLFLTGIIKNFRAYLVNGSFGFHVLGSAAPVAKFFWWLAWLPLLLRLRNPLYLLLGLLSLGIAVSAPVLMSDGGFRVFAATAAVDATQVAIGVGAFVYACVPAAAWIRSFWASNPMRERGLALPTDTRAALDASSALLALGILLLPFTPLARLGIQPSVVFNGCGEGETTVVSRINRGGNITLNIVGARQSIRSFHGTVVQDDLANGSLWPWSAELYSDLPLSFAGRSFFLASLPQLDRKGVPKRYFGYVDDDLSLYDGKLMAFCGDEREVRRLFDRPYLKLRIAGELEIPP